MNHERYLIYKLKDRTVYCELKDCIIDGMVDEVYRDVMTKRIRIKVSHEEFHFDEPDFIIEKENGVIVFVYGNPELSCSDDDVFSRMRGTYGGTIDDALEDTRLKDIKFVRFRYEEKKKRRKRISFF